LKKKEFKEGDKVLLYNSRFKTFGKRNCKASGTDLMLCIRCSPTETVTIMDINGDQFVVNGQWLKVYYEPDVVPLHHVDVFTMEEEPERPA
jgi:hypothetical protein